jgi:hypothetical protein
MINYLPINPSIQFPSERKIGHSRSSDPTISCPSFNLAIESGNANAAVASLRDWVRFR